MPNIQEISSKENQIEFLFNQIKKLGSNKNDIAILIRNKDFDYLSDLKLKFVKNDIGYIMVGEFPLLKRKIIKDLMAILKFLITDSDNISLNRIIKNMRLGLGEQFYNKIKEISVQENIKSYYHIMKNYEKYKELKRYSSKIEKFVDKFKDYNMEKSFVIVIEKVVQEFFDEVILSEYHYLQEFIREVNRYYEKKWLYNFK